MERPVTWRWEMEKLGKVAHAGDDGGEETLCGAPAPGPALFHGPWFQFRCAECEHLRGGRLEVFRNSLS